MNAQDVLRNYQTQLDAEGIQVGVSRQALDETLERIAELEAAYKDERKDRLRLQDRVIELEDSLRSANSLEEYLREENKQLAEKLSESETRNRELDEINARQTKRLIDLEDELWDKREIEK